MWEQKQMETAKELAQILEENGRLKQENYFLLSTTNNGKIVNIFLDSYAEDY